MMYGLNNVYGGWSTGSMMGWFGGGFMMIAFWILIVAIIALVVREFGGKSSRSHSHSNALDILKERYAKGEIDKKEFEEKKKDLIN